MQDGIPERPLDPAAVKTAEKSLLTPRNERRMKELLEALCDPTRVKIVRALRETTLAAGVHWRWPAPFERMRREKVGLLRALQLGFRAERGTAAAHGAFVRPIEWQAEHIEPAGCLAR